MGTFIETRPVTFFVEECCNCGVQFGITDSLHEQRLNDRQFFYCPNGHSQHYIGKTEAQKLKEQLETERRSVEFWRERNATTERSKAAIKGQLTKVKNRVGHGVCPCCNRSFENLKRHMTSKHPKVVANPEA